MWLVVLLRRYMRFTFIKGHLNLTFLVNFLIFMVWYKAKYHFLRSINFISARRFLRKWNHPLLNHICIFILQTWSFNEISYKKVMSLGRCWWRLFDAGDIFKKFPKRPASSVSDIRHLHRCSSKYFKLLTSLFWWQSKYSG